MDNGKKMLILELGGIGDVILSLPAIEAILTAYKDCCVTVLTTSITGQIIGSLHQKGFDNFKIITTDALAENTFACWWKLLKALRRQRFSIVIDLSAIETRKAAVKRYFFMKAMNAGELVGRDTDGRGWAFTKKAPEALTSPEHEVERKIRVAEMLGLKSSQTIPGIVTSRDEKEKAAAILSGFSAGKGLLACINPGAYRPARMWPEENFREIISFLISDMSAKVVLIGGGRERDIVERLASSFPAERIRTFVDIPLLQLAAVIERMTIIITNDSGPMHIAAALNVPTVAMFGQTNLHRYHPCMDNSRYIALKSKVDLCGSFSFENPMSECRRHDCAGNICMASITVDEVREAARSLLSRLGFGSVI